MAPLNWNMKQIITVLFLTLCIVTNSFAQDEELQKKNLPDTILSPIRVLEMPEPFDGQKALQKLFPGKYYNLSSGDYNNELISWECKSCETQYLLDVNEADRYDFPYKEGVATRLLKVISYTDSSGTKYKMLTFNHSWYDADGAQTSRFTGGTLGLAKFVLIGGKWVMKFYQPAIGAYGAFSRCPEPEPMLIGHDQYAFMLKMQNGGGGGPFSTHLFLIAGTGGEYKEVFAAYDVGRTEGPWEEPNATWDVKYSIPESGKRFFRDIIVTMKGEYLANDIESLPEEVQAPAKATGKKKGHFTVTRRYVFKWGKGYQVVPGSKAILD